MRTFIGSMLIKAGIAILPDDVREMLRGMVLYHVPGALNEREKAIILAARTRYMENKS